MPELDLDRLVEAVLKRVLERLGASVPAAGTAAARPWSDPRWGGSWPQTRTPLVAANWKMNGPKTASAGTGAGAEDTPEGMQSRISEYAAELAGAPADRVETVLMPPAVLLGAVRRALARAGADSVALGSQDIHPEASGAHTGELSGPLVRSAGATWTLAGHSERRAAGETHESVARKIRAGLSQGMKVMACVGETAGQRNSRATFRVLRNQVTAALSGTALKPPEPDRLAVAYEPVWAIGTGVRAEPAQIQEASAFIRQVLSEVYDFNRANRIRILYGGSVNPGNAGETVRLQDVDGLLVGGASLRGADFTAIVEAALGASMEKEGKERKERPDGR